MSKSLNSYQDLLDEKKRLKTLMAAQKQLIVADVAEMKEELKPVGTALSFLGKVTTKESGNMLLTGGTNKLIDILFKNVILSRAGWITKLVIPFVVKNYSSHYIADHKNTILKKFFSLVGIKGKKHPAQGNGQVIHNPAEKNHHS